MEQIIERNMRCRVIQNTASSIGINLEQTWDLFYESGSDYLDFLTVRMKKKRDFDTMFKSMLQKPGFGSFTPREIITKIRNSQVFWEWWSMQMWCICEHYSFTNKDELKSTLAFCDPIPEFILTKIFYGKQKPQSTKRTDAEFNREVDNSGTTQSKVRKGDRSKV